MQGSELTRAKVRSALVFLAPMLLALALAAGWPLGRTLWFAFTDATLTDTGSYAFVGFENFWNPDWGGLLEDANWWTAVGNTLYFTVLSVTLETILGVGIALALDVPFRGRAIVRAAVLIPWAIPTIVSAKMWGWMLHDQFGLINDLGMKLGLIDQPVAWMASSATALTAIVAVDVWKTTPFMALLVLAALQMLPRDIYEAARIDGIHPVRVFFRVTLPLIRPALMVAVIFRGLDALRAFDLMYAMTGNNESTMTMSVFARQQLVDFQDVGYGSAAAALLFVMVAVLTAAVLTLGRVRLTGGVR
ncbi:sugar ABC transporter permease [Paroceanicella profunda]|uniref:Sugar ABC transporter permease n=1 Tax=Paroceanicella profunda TaxID=2579971 RepID=A0A5B8FY24_9RHOB|nr:sugar ABC transporter permease [Paroceanicella profunda]QDL93395.1 sugar ABC transporter permease [Paroceanicella profunda]